MAVGSNLRAMIGEIESDTGSALSAVERLLLSTDGTVTHAIEALTRTEINVRPITRHKGGNTLHRDVVLEQVDGGEEMVYARSTVNLEHVEAGIAEELVNGDRGIGGLLRNRGAETHRHINSMGVKDSSDPYLPMFVGRQSDTYLERTYTVESDGVELMEITEWFPRTRY